MIFHNKNFKNIYLPQILLVALTLIAYSGLAGNGFIALDDSVYIYDSPMISKLFSAEGIRHAFSIENGASYWHPLTTLSHMLDYQFFGLNPAGYHIVNLLIHVANSLLLMHFLMRATGKMWPSVFAAALFALHPLNVETVAWATERKNTLSMLFMLSALLSYTWYAKRTSLARYALVAMFFGMGLMSKSMLVSLPLLMLVLDFWPLRRLNADNGSEGGSTLLALIAEKIPLLILSALSVFISLQAFSKSLGVINNIDTPLANKLANAVTSYACYPLKLLWPTGLSIYYPLRQSHGALEVIICLIAIMIISTSAILSIRRYPWLFAGWSWYALTLFPVSGIVRRGLWPEMADRFTYLPAIGLFIIAAWGIHELLDSLRREGRMVGVCCCSALILILASMTGIQVGRWHDSKTIFLHSLSVTDNNDVMLKALGELYCEEKDFSKGLEYLGRAEQINPNFVDSLNLCRGKQEWARGDFAAAEKYFFLVIQMMENNFQALYLLAYSEEQSGKLELAVRHFNQVARSPLQDAKTHRHLAAERAAMLLPRVFPEYDSLRQAAAAPTATPEMIGMLAIRLDGLGMYEEALQWYRRLDSPEAKNWQIWYNMANVQKKMRRFKDAAVLYRRVIEVRPDFKDAHNNLGTVYLSLGDYTSALAVFDKLLQLDPEFDFARFNRAKTLLKMNMRQSARQGFTELLGRSPEVAEMSRSMLRGMDMK